MYIWYDPDEWETVVENETYGKILGHSIGRFSVGQRRRPAEEVAKIKAEKRRIHEDEVLAEAAEIMRRRKWKMKP